MLVPVTDWLLLGVFGSSEKCVCVCVFPLLTLVFSVLLEAASAHLFFISGCYDDRGLHH